MNPGMIPFSVNCKRWGCSRVTDDDESVVFLVDNSLWTRRRRGLETDLAAPATLGDNKDADVQM